MTEILVSTKAELDAVFDEHENVLVLFTAPTWCRPCQQLEPHWNSLVETLDNYATVKVDLGASPEDTAGHWATFDYGVRGVPQIYAWGTNADGDWGGPVVIKGRTVVQIMHELGH